MGEVEGSEVASSLIDNTNSSRKHHGICEMCNKETAKYTCPACQTRTCSLPCVKDHKNKLECDGLKLRTKFLPLAKINDEHLKQDCKLLEEIGSTIYALQKTSRKYIFRKDQEMPIQFKKLSHAVYLRGSRINYLPKGFLRHKQNSTYYDWKQRLISWRVQLVFLHARKTVINIQRCDENTILHQLVSHIINGHTHQTEAESLPKVQRSLKCYKTAGISSIDVLMKCEKMSNSDSKFYKLDKNETLKTNFVGKTIVEFPQLYVVIKGFYGATPVPDEEAKSNQHSFIATKSNVNATLFDSAKSNNASDSSESDSISETEMDFDLEFLTNVVNATKT